MFSQRKVPNKLVYLFLAFLLLFLLDKFGFSLPVRRMLEKSFIIPVKQEIFQLKRIFKKDLETCRLENERVLSELKAQVVVLSEENKEQKRLLSAPLPGNWQFLAAKVVEAENETLTLALGEDDGVKPEMVAVLEKTYLGKIFRVTPKMAEVKLPTFFGERLVVKIVSVEDQKIVGRGLLFGLGAGKMKIEQIYSSEPVKQRDLVMVETEGGSLLVGEVQEVIYGKGEVFKTALVERLYNPEDLNIIFLIRGKI